MFRDLEQDASKWNNTTTIKMHVCNIFCVNKFIKPNKVKNTENAS